MTAAAETVVFSDFNGTLLDADLVGGMAETFVPIASRPILAALRQGQVAERDGLAQLYALYRTPARDAYRLWARSAGGLRPGAPELLAALDKAAIPFHVVSSGLSEWVWPHLAGLLPPDRLWANQGDWTMGSCRVAFPVHCAPDTCRRGCGLCKPTVMQRVGAGLRTVLIGDGQTDVAAALAADVVLARPPLTTLLDERGRPYHRYDTFFDVQAVLETLNILPAVRS